MQQQTRDRTGFVATGPGFYIWEETRIEAARTAQELSGGADVTLRRAPHPDVAQTAARSDTEGQG